MRAAVRDRIFSRTSILLAATLAVAMLFATAQATAKGKHKHRPKPQASALIASDTGSDPDANNFWGRDYCASNQQVQDITTGGDPHLTATGAPQGNSSFRRMTAFDGDDVWGERCELGWDDRNSPTAFYRPGKHRITEISIRLPSPFPLGAFTWQSVMQMKEAAPIVNSSATPMLELDAYGGRWRLRQNDSPRVGGDSRQIWSAPAAINVWTRFLFNIRYSTNPRKGFIQIGVDLDGDGDFADPGELSRVMHTYTLKEEMPPGGDGIRPGQAVPSHLRAGIYHNPSIPCPRPTGCSVDIDNVQVLRP
jgi:hypothetical protein